MKLTVVAVTVVLLATLTECHKVLITCAGVGGSNNFIMYRVAEILASRNMDATVFKYDINLSAKTPKLKLAKEIVTKPVSKEQSEKMERMMDTMPWEILTGFQMWSQLAVIQESLVAACEGIVADEKLIARLKAEKFDVVIIHVGDICGFGLMELLGIRSYIWFSTAFLYDPMAWISGSPNLVSYVPSTITANLPIMSLTERVKNTFGLAVSLATFKYAVVPKYTEIYRRRFGPQFPDVYDLIANTSVFFINSDIFYDYPRPLMPNVVNIGGLTMVEPVPLTKEWEEIVNNSRKDGIILFAMGSIVNTNLMPNEIRTAFLNAFKRFPDFTVIWKYDGSPDELKSAPNVVASNWVPQKDLLVNPKLRLFITHGGFNSLTEASAAGVPLVVLPLFSDQHSNAKRCEWFRTCATLERTNLTEDSIFNAIHTVISDQSFGERAQRMAKMVQKKPISSLDLAVSWVEFVAEFKTLEDLKPYGNQLHLYQYLLLDVFGILGLILLGIGVFSSLAVWFCCRLCCRRSTITKQPEKIKSQKAKKPKLA